ncbi:ComEC/Rec2 family competence protein [Myroides odoratimimus]|uniref:ComEC/Rec2 family competence protein n=1 Tax=Myroides odoratimimus TaxID=76832 RepID=UPI00091A3E9E|nr:MBL fold metallo-hydrolase [Myroides odoratimimus]SHL61639.1 Metal-dependent hydrolase, beta-lactamase superfamily II [Myroides odoratimimus subsp. xuanwuensis]
MKIKFLKAFNGDAIWISFLENDIPRNILIDGGIGDTFKTTKGKPGELFEVIEFIKNNEQSIDLLVLTHFDDDHIGGILRWLNKDKEASNLIKKVWFNSGKEIADKFKSDENPDLDIEIVDGTDDFYTSPKQGIKFENYLRNNNLWEGEIIEQGQELTLLGLKFKILSPNDNKLENLLELYQKQEDYFTSGSKCDFKTTLKDFIETESQPDFKFKEDYSVANGSSIAFILEYENKNFLFLADAHPSVIIEGLTKLGYNKDNPLNAEFMKVSHHGSSHNTNMELLEIVKTDKYIISSNATKHGLPNKRTIARIINNNANTVIHFNYDLTDRVFLEEDWNDFLIFKAKVTNEFTY